MEKSELRNLLASIAFSQIGVKETGGNNIGAQIVEYQKATWLEPAAWPWCSAFVCWCLREWLNEQIVSSLMFRDNAILVEKWRCKDSRAFGWIDWAKRKNIAVVSESAKAMAGDIVIYDFSHCGIVTEDQPWYSRSIVAVEGNTNGQGERDSESGDGVWKKTRHQSLVKAYVRIVV